MKKTGTKTLANEGIIKWPE